MAREARHFVDEAFCYFDKYLAELSKNSIQITPNLVLFLTKRVAYQELPQNNAKCSKTASSTKWRASRAIFAGLFWRLFQFFVIFGKYFQRVLQ